MTEFKRTTQAVDEIEALVQSLLDGTNGDLQHLGELIGKTGATVEKLSRKAAETDPTRQTYGPQMREKVNLLAERWASVGGLARDVLTQRGGHVVAPVEGDTGPPPPPRPVQSAVLWQPPQAPATAASTAAPMGAVTAPSQPSAAERRERAAAAAERRSQPSTASQPVQPSQSSGSARQPVPVVARMDSLMHLVHCVFVGHGYQNEHNEDRSGLHKLRYIHERKQAILAVYVPLQQHLVTYVTIDGSSDSPIKATVQVGMPVAAVQAKIDYLLLYPLLYRQCLPTLESTPPEALFGSLCGLSIPALASLGCTCRSMSASVLNDDLVWLRVALSLAPSRELQAELAAVKRREENGEALPQGIYKGMVRTEVRRLRREAEEEQRRRREDALARQRLRDPLLLEPPRRPQPGFPGLGGNRPIIIGGPHDLDPRGFGGRPNPFGGGGMGGGGGFGGFGPRFH